MIFGLGEEIPKKRSRESIKGSSSSGTAHAAKKSLMARSTSFGNTFCGRWKAKKNRFINAFSDSPSLCRRSKVNSALGALEMKKNLPYFPPFLTGAALGLLHKMTIDY